MPSACHCSRYIRCLAVFRQAADIEIHAKETRRINELVNGIISKHSGRSAKDLQKDMDRDYFMTAEHALEYGIVDEIIMPKDAKVPA